MLGENINVYPIDEATENLQLNGMTFRRESDYDANAFYDWLRNRNGKIVGLKLDLEEESQYLIERIEEFDYVKTENKRTYYRFVYLFFGKDRKFDRKLSGDQAFWNCFLYFSEGKIFGMTFLLPSSDGQCVIL
jgi:hypothetical protein